jgi:Zn-dependent membrane protease YugP
MFIGFDPLYFIIMAPGLLLAMWAQSKVQSAFAEGSRYPSRSGITGAEAAARVMGSEGLRGIAIEPVHGALTDHYDPTSKVLRLSEPVYAERSLSALGVAAHEAGHALQDAHHYGPLKVRNLMVPVASLGSSASWILIMVGLMLGASGSFLGSKILVLGMLLFSGVVLFQLVNLPVEFDASRRAREALQMNGLVSAEEDQVVGRVLNAAAWTYVAGTLTSALTLVYYALRSGLLGGSSDDR